MKIKKNLMQVGQKQVVGSVVHVQLLYQGVPAKNAHNYLLEILLTSPNFPHNYLLFEKRQFTVYLAMFLSPFTLYLSAATKSFSACAGMSGT